MQDLPFSIDFDLYEIPELYRSWLAEKSSLKIKEIGTLFAWDCKDGKTENTDEGFNQYLLSLFKTDLSNGWSISEEIDPFKLLPLEIQAWYTGLYFFNAQLLMDAWCCDDRYPGLELADYVKEIYEDEERRADWSIATPDTLNEETG